MVSAAWDLEGQVRSRQDPRDDGHGEARSRSTLHIVGVVGSSEMRDGRGRGWECWEVRRGGWAEPGVAGLECAAAELGA